MFKNLSIPKKLYAGFGTIVIILLALLFTSYNNFTNLLDANRLDRHTLGVLLTSHAIETELLDIQAEYRGFLLTGNEGFMGRLVSNEESMKKRFQQLKELTADNAAQQDRIKRVELLVNAWLSETVRPLMEKRRALAKAPDAASQIAREVALVEGMKRVSAAHDLLEEFKSEEDRLLVAREKNAVSMSKNMLMVLSVGGIVSVAAAIGIALLLSRAVLRPLTNLTGTISQLAAGNQSARAEVLSKDELGKVTEEVNRMAEALQESQRREQAQVDDLRSKVDSLLMVVSRAAAGDLTGRVAVSGSDAIGRLGEGLAAMFDNLRTLVNRVQKAGIQVATSTTEIAASAKQQEATGVEQAQTSVEVLSTTKEISANTAQLLKAMEEVTHVAEYTTSATTDAQSNLRRMDATMQRMVTATDTINAKLAALSEKASNINNVLTTITKVADQTNILSLNAAIEAEKAGEAGRGFSVVATEIRRLADQTSVATWDIEQMLKEMQSAVSASVMGMDKFSDEIRRSVGEVSQVGEQLSSVIEQVRNLTPRFDMVLEGMQSQAIGASQITETMTQLNEATQQAVDALKATSEAVQQLQYAAQDLQAGVSSFAVNM
ncbi:MAG TPA: methyl-accepting chemotaxis protein [Noviherbaspirillum sp.]|uniref:methyl-accepting chemotaxis protein n=1 Tax=Noviherbaspirillum sp. TaxID=1926288 RepID=UPI002D3EE4AD|nr:methyl-accepting chemotaxis protein [Noviherbaspirillum sp.]HYD97560.1 methyl-accepting chemotaxis protein [Noviherbaspirillum sp.]